MKRLACLLTIIVLALTASSLRAQSTAASQFDRYREQKKAEFSKWSDSRKTEFERYRAKLNDDYARMMEGKWSAYNSTPGRERARRPEPVKPIDASKAPASAPGSVKIDAVEPPQPAIPDIPVTLPKVQPGQQAAYPVTFNFYHTPCGIRSFDTSLLDFKSLTPSALSKAWRRLADSPASATLLDDCLRLREQLNLPDWGYMKMLEALAAKLYPLSTDKQAFLTVFLMTQSGYDTRLAMRDGTLCMLFHPSHLIYSESFFNFNGKKYFVSGPLSKSAKQLSTFDFNFREGATPVRMAMHRIPRLSTGTSTPTVYSSRSWTGAPPFEVRVNPTVIEFMSDYPLLDWQLYGMSQLSEPLLTSLLPALDMLTEGLSERDAVNLLLDFCQKGFSYMTDGNQFGFEKPFFFDENFFYPANDCEDRAILFAKLVKTLLKLDVVYLNYPRHLAAAVRFNVDPGGSYVTVDGQRYTVCDPTCINGRAGYLASVYSGISPKVVKITE